MNRPQQMNLAQLCQLFEIDVKEIPDLRPGPMPLMEKKLEQVKEIFKKAYRKLATKYHPDKGASEKEVEHFKKITSVYREFRKLKVVPVPKPMPVRRTVVVRTSFGGATSSATRGSWGGTWHWNYSDGGTWRWSSSGGVSDDDTA